MKLPTAAVLARLLTLFKRKRFCVALESATGREEEAEPSRLKAEVTLAPLVMVQQPAH